MGAGLTGVAPVGAGQTWALGPGWGGGRRGGEGRGAAGGRAGGGEGRHVLKTSPGDVDMPQNSLHLLQADQEGRVAKASSACSSSAPPHLHEDAPRAETENQPSGSHRESCFQALLMDPFPSPFSGPNLTPEKIRDPKQERS